MYKLLDLRFTILKQVLAVTFTIYLLENINSNLFSPLSELSGIHDNETEMLHIGHTDSYGKFSHCPSPI